MTFAVITRDRPGALQIRKDTREAHLEYIAATGVVTMAGPFLGADGDMDGSLVILDVADMAAAQEWAENDPYARAGLFESVEIRAWKKVIG
ncbi:YciI family protein [Limimaricola sp.]|uniref:YciI family protein n=1 Tax=Limimaricola sp. TaxID=2211665 RepID=UPI0040580C03